MLKGSPNLGISKHPAQYILEAPASDIDRDNLNLYSFDRERGRGFLAISNRGVDEYFNLYKYLTIAIIRQWIGQSSNSEHNRALSLLKKKDNLPWVFNNVVGKPRTGWRNDFPKSERKTVYFLMIEKK